MYYVGIDVGGMSIKGGVVDEAGKIYNRACFTTELDISPEAVIEKMAAFILDIIKKTNITIDDIAGIGLGIPGTIDNNIVRFANNLNWHMVPIVDILADKLKYDKSKIYAENDANAAILGEIYCGVCKDKKNAIMITLGTGVGTGIVSDGRLIVGNGSCGAEGGHMVVNPNGELCTCGRKGCYEVYSSATALIRITKKAIEAHPESKLKTIAENYGKVSGRTAFDAFREGDSEGRRIVKDYINYVALGITNLSNLLRPEVVVIGGGISNEGEWFINAIQAEVDKGVYGGITVNPRVMVVKASLGNDAGIVGAAALAIYKHFNK